MDLKSLGLFLAFVAAWFTLNRWVLPYFGVQTCMSGGCSSGACSAPAELPPVTTPTIEDRTPSSAAVLGGTNEPPIAIREDAADGDELTATGANHSTEENGR